jgi:hypothetical protein
MPVTPTIAELILREIVTRLEVNEDFTVYREVMAPEKMTPTNYQLVVKTISHTRQPALDRIGNPPVIAYDLTVGIFGQLGVSESDCEAIEGHQYEISGRIVQSITTGASWWTFGSRSLNCTIGDVQLLGPTYSGQVTLNITYRVPENDPFTVAG